MKTRMTRMARAFAVLMLVCMFMTAGHALAEVRTYTYGGSGSDELLDIAASADGRIVMTGYTNSTDGTLASRTKSGHSGWALCVDAQGNVLWSFCSRLGTADTMAAPVFHEDGSVTVVLCADRGAQDAYELIRLDQNGEVVSRKTMLEGDTVQSMRIPRATGGGYVLRQEDENLEPISFTLFDFDGEIIRTLYGWEVGGAYMAYLLAENHVLRGVYGGALLTAIDSQGYESILAEPDDLIPNAGRYTVYLGLVSLPDGGVAAAGRVVESGKRQGRLTRWDAQGQVLFDWWVQMCELLDIAYTGSGFVSLLLPGEQGLSLGEGQFTWSLACFDENGVQTGSVPLPQTDSYNGVIAVLPDGSVAVAQNVTGEDGSEDVCLTIVPKEDIP